jgi:single-strand DNA-binding protein
MAAGVNEWHGVGNMTADPELKQGDDPDKNRTMFSIAVNKTGDQPPTYIDMICWGKLANQVNDFGRKGRQVYVRGELEVRKWEDEEGKSRRAYRIKAYTVRFLDKRPDNDEPQPQRQQYAAEDYDDLPF